MKEEYFLNVGDKIAHRDPFGGLSYMGEIDKINKKYAYIGETKYFHKAEKIGDTVYVTEKEEKKSKFCTSNYLLITPNIMQEFKNKKILSKINKINWNEIPIQVTERILWLIEGTSNLIFLLDEAQLLKLDEWKKSLPPIETGAIGGEFAYKFSPTSLGTVVKVTRNEGEEIDLTDYESW